MGASVFIALCILAYFIFRKRKFYLLSWQLSGPFALPIIGNGLSFLCNDDELLERTVNICTKYSSPFRLWFGPKFTVVITDADQAQKIMSSHNFLTKDPDIYRFLQPFDGKGLITSSGLKWRNDRRMISPLFSKKNILQYFAPILEQTKILVKILEPHIDKPEFNIEPLVHRCTADFVNSTLLGVKTNAQFHEMDDFLKTLHRMYTIIHARIVKVWLQSEILFRLSPYWMEHEEGKKVILEFIEKVINKNNFNPEIKTFQPIITQLMDMANIETGFCVQQDLKDHLVTLYSAVAEMHMHKGLYLQMNLQQDVSDWDRENFRIKDTRLAEILIETLTSRYNITKAEKYQSIYWWRLIEFFSLGIYIFCKNSEDTVTLITSFIMVLLGMYPEIQEKVIQEIYCVVGHQQHEIAENHLDKLEYLDWVIKETMRLFPIASFIVRRAENEFFLTEKCSIPADCSVIVSIYNIHRDGKHYEKPDQFYPDHFLPDKVQKRHPYAFMPFSGGQRGCIGKPFAYMALKILLVTLLQNFVVEADGKLEDLELKTDISIRPKNELFPVRLKKRIY